MFPLILTLLNRDHNTPIVVPHKDCQEKGEHPKGNSFACRLSSVWLSRQGEVQQSNHKMLCFPRLFQRHPWCFTCGLRILRTPAYGESNSSCCIFWISKFATKLSNPMNSQMHQRAYLVISNAFLPQLVLRRAQNACKDGWTQTRAPDECLARQAITKSSKTLKAPRHRLPARRFNRRNAEVKPLSSKQIVRPA